MNIRVLWVPVDGSPAPILCENSIAGFQKLLCTKSLAFHLQCLCMDSTCESPQKVFVFYIEDGEFLGLKPNRGLWNTPSGRVHLLRDISQLRVEPCFYGNFLVVAVDQSLNFCNLNDQALEYYSRIFRFPGYDYHSKVLAICQAESIDDEMKRYLLNAEHMDIPFLCMTLPGAYLEEFSTRMEWACISIENKKLSEDFVRRYSNQLVWQSLCRHQKCLSESFWEENSDKVDWMLISMHQKLSNDFIDRHANQLDWYCLCRNQSLSEELLRKHSTRLHWIATSIHQKLSMDFLRDYASCLDWSSIVMHRKLTRTQMREFAERLDWDLIAEHQVLSEDTMWEFADRFNLDLLFQNQKMSAVFRKQISQKVRESQK